MQLGSAIANVRKQAKKDQKTLAGDLGITVTYLSLIENGKKKPSPALLTAIAECLGVPVSVLLFDALKDTLLKSKKHQETFKAAEPLINQLVELIVSDKEDEPEVISTRKKSKKNT